MFNAKLMGGGTGLFYVYRGGNWNNTSNAGVFNFNANNTRANADNNIGFRSALLLCRVGYTPPTGAYQCIVPKGSVSLPMGKRLFC